MATYKGKAAVVARPAHEIAEMFTDLRAFQAKLDALPQEKRDKLSGVQLEQDSVTFDVNMVGRVKLVVKERTPQRVTFVAEGVPMNLSLYLDIEETPQGTKLTPATELDVPFMLRAMVGPQIQKAMDQVGAYLGQLA